MVQEYLFKDHTDLPEHRVKAIQYTGDKEGIAEVLRLVPQGKVALLGEGLSILTPFRWVSVQEGGFIIHSTDGQFYVFPEVTFKRYYELA